MAKSLNRCDTIDDVIKYGKASSLLQDSLYLKSKITSNNKDIIINSTSFVNKYSDQFKAVTRLETLSDEDLLQYRYQPKLFCYTRYGTVELWSVLLKVNNMLSATDFNKQTIRVFTNKIFEVINEILINEKEKILDNKESL